MADTASLQEAILSSAYIVETLAVLRTSLRTETRSIMRQLVVINVAIILMDVGLLGIEYASLFLLETILKGFIYSIKLKMEFAILSRLVKFVGGGRVEPVRARSMTLAAMESDVGINGALCDTSDILQLVDLSKVNGDYSHVAEGFQSSAGRARRASKEEISEIEDV